MPAHRASLTTGAQRALTLAVALLALGLAAPAVAGASPAPAGQRPLPTGRVLDPAGRASDLGNMPLALAAPPRVAGGPADRVVVLLNGWREQGLQVVEPATGRIVQTLALNAAFLGLAFAPDGGMLYVSGGNDDVIYRYTWRAGTASPAGRIELGGGPAEGVEATGEEGKSDESARGDASEHRRAAAKGFPAGLALSPDGRRLYVAENLGDSLAVVELASGRVVQRLPAGSFPYAVAVAPDGAVYVSCWGGAEVRVFVPAGRGLAEAARIEAGRHPSALLLNASGSRLFVASASTDQVAVVDTRARKVLTTLFDPPASGPREGSTPDALALSADGRRLLVAEADSNAVAVFELAAATSGLQPGGLQAGGLPATGAAGPRGAPDRLAGRIPVGWYPTALLLRGEELLVVNGKGRGTGPNPRRPQVGSPKSEPESYTLGQTSGTLTVVPARLDGAELARLTARVARANGWGARTASGGGRAAPSYPPFEHVVYVIKENRTYDQVFSDLPQGDGDPALLFFPRAISPNHHALAERFGLYDRFFTNGEVSTQGHLWSTAAYVTDYVEKTTPSGYSSRRPELEEGSEPLVPAGGFLWSLARAKGLSVRDYGEFGIAEKQAASGPRDEHAVRYTSFEPSLAPFVHPEYPPFDLSIPDQRRADIWLADLAEHVRRGAMPALEIVWLPNDHTSGAKAGMPSPRAAVADNDLAQGRMIAALTRTPFWKSTVVFVVEDDAQAGPDHFDSHRAPMLVVSAYNRPGVVHRFVNTTDVLATIEQILGLGTLSQFDTYGRPLAEVFAATPDLRPYDALTPQQALDEKNPGETKAARDSLELDLSRADAADPELLNRILWRTIKGEAAPYPGAARASTLDFERAF